MKAPSTHIITIIGSGAAGQTTQLHVVSEREALDWLTNSEFLEWVVSVRGPGYTNSLSMYLCALPPTPQEALAGDAKWPDEKKIAYWHNERGWKFETS